MQGSFYLSVINYPYGPPEQPNTPICTLFCIQYWDNATGTWGHFTPWTSIYDPAQITCDLSSIGVIAYVGNADQNDPNSPMTIPTDGSTVSPTIPIAAGGHYRLNLNARPGQSGKVVFEVGDWIPGPRPGQTSKTGLLIGAAVFVVGVIATIAALVSTRSKK